MTTSGRSSDTQRRDRNQGVLALVLGTAVVALIVITVSVLTPVSHPLAVRPTSSRTPTAPPSVVAAPTDVPTSSAIPIADGVPPQIVLVEGDLIANPPEFPLWSHDSTILAATGLGERQGYSAIGYVTDADQVCIYMYTDNGGHGDCSTTYAEFNANGATLEHNGWQIHWWADGRVEWID
jgi:hypothetical protein